MSVIASARRVLPVPGWISDVRIPSEVYRILFHEGVPQNFVGRRFRLDDEASRITSDKGLVLRFGTTGLSNAVGIDSCTMHVVYVI